MALGCCAQTGRSSVCQPPGKETDSPRSYLHSKQIYGSSLLAGGQKGVTPHVIRHSKAMHLLRADVDLHYIRDFLGHVQIETTEVYARADAEMKRKALETANLDLPAESQTSWQKDQSLLSWLQSL